MKITYRNIQDIETQAKTEKWNNGEQEKLLGLLCGLTIEEIEKKGEIK